jgi:hypothetical protein
MAEVPNERQLLAERWRLLGEKLRKRSPAAFEKMIEMLAASATDTSEEETSEIDGIYRVH